MTLLAGVDIGNRTTEICLASLDFRGNIEYLGSSLQRTTGIKGTPDNLPGIILALETTAKQIGRSLKDIDLLRINEASPVIGDVAMETITETIITESTMIGHNPDTPGGAGLGRGITVSLGDLGPEHKNMEIIPVIDQDTGFEEAVARINRAIGEGIRISGLIIKNDDGVLIANRLAEPLPIVDEVERIDLVPLGMLCAVEVAEPGQTIKTLSNPFGIAGVFDLTPEETKAVVPIAKALIGNRSAVVIRTPQGEVKERKIPAGSLIIQGARGKTTVDINEGSAKVMEWVTRLGPLVDVWGEAGTNVGGMLKKVKTVMAGLTGQSLSDLGIQDLLAVDTNIPQKVRGGVAGEFARENAVALAAMVKTNRLPMEEIARRLEGETGIRTEIAGIEANMALLGAMTTPGTAKPLAILDLGAGSSDAALINREGKITSVHLAGAGDLVNMLINSELGLEDLDLAEDIKRYPLGKVESLFHLRLEDGTVKFFAKSLPPHLFARVVIMKDEENFIPLNSRHSPEHIRNIRREAKRKVFVTNALRALAQVSPTGNIRHIEYVVLVGGSCLDFEIPEMISHALAEYGIVCGQGNIRGREGPRNAVATGLVLSYLKGD